MRENFLSDTLHSASAIDSKYLIMQILERQDSKKQTNKKHPKNPKPKQKRPEIKRASNKKSKINACIS